MSLSKSNLLLSNDFSLWVDNGLDQLGMSHNFANIVAACD